MSTIPQELGYTGDHEWVSTQDGKVGITEYAANSLGDVVYVQLPEVGATVEAGEPCGEIESTKSVSDIFAPATGTVEAVNQAVVDDPALINSDPYGEGWLFRVTFDGDPDLLDAEAYAKLTAEDA